MLAWMIYVVIVTIALCISAFIAERAARHTHASSRWIWMAAILASLLIPTIIASVSIQIPNLSTSAVSQKLIVLREATSVHVPSAWIGATSTGPTAALRNFEVLLPWLWTASSTAMMIALIVSAALLSRRKREWDNASVGEVPVYVAADVGPAVVGLLRPRIVVPVWLTRAPASQLQLVVAHEQSHLDAHDPLLLTIALCLLVAMPWNLPLWWQLRRLRCAIEVDCDARVLLGGHDVKAYGETLIEVGEHQSTYLGAVAAMSESKSFLQQRLEIMLLKPGRWSRIAATALVCLSIAVAGIAAQVSPPNATTTEPQVSVGPSVLARYVGYYKLGETLVRVALNGAQLVTQITGQPAVDLFPKNESEFFAKAVNVQISFVRDAEGQATALVVHQNGHVQTAPRIDDAAAIEINNAIAARVKSQMPMPGSEAALRRTIDGIYANPPNFDAMSPDLAEVTQEQMPMIRADIAKMGAVQSIEFLGVTDQGMDKFLVRYEHGTHTAYLMVDVNGVVTVEGITP